MLLELNKMKSHPKIVRVKGLRNNSRFANHYDIATLYRLHVNEEKPISPYLGVPVLFVS